MEFAFLASYETSHSLLLPSEFQHVMISHVFTLLPLAPPMQPDYIVTRNSTVLYYNAIVEIRDIRTFYFLDSVSVVENFVYLHQCV